MDFHTHILPGIDDGSADPAESVELLRMEAEQGIRNVLLTPHFYAAQDDPEDFLRRREEARLLLLRETAGREDLPRIRVGAEVSFFRGMSESEYLPRLTVEGGKCILIEMPPAPWPESCFRELERIWHNWGIIPVIAHIDRYIGPLRNRRILRRLARLPVLVQANGSFFLRPSTAGMAMRLLKKDQIHLLGSDCHDTQVRKPNLDRVLDRVRAKLGEDAVERIRVYQRQVLEPEESAVLGKELKND